MSKKSGIITLASLSLLIVGCGDSSQVPSSSQNDRTSQAEQPSQRSGDGNNNNKQTMDKSERMEMQQPSFSQLDSDGNGSISKEEAQEFEDLALYFKQLDRNKDNKIDSDEFRNFKAMQMRSFDHGGDSGAEYGEHGALSTQQQKSEKNQESSYAGEGNPTEQPSQRSGDGNNNNKQTMDKSERMEMQQPSFSQLDSDGNGSISKEEAQEFEDLALYFKQLDRNKDNKIDSDEFRNFKAMQMRSFDHGGDSGAEYGEHGALSTQQNKSTTNQEQ